MFRIAFAFLWLTAPVIAVQNPRTVAESALEAWHAHDSKRLLAVAHPELLKRLRDSTLVRFYVTRHEDKRSVVVSGSDAEVAALFCEALQVIVPAQFNGLDHLDRYVETRYKGDLAIVIFDSGWRGKSGDFEGIVSRNVRIVLKKSGDEWKFLWSPAVSIHVDLDWKPIEDDA
jgi:hypothetical protein